jgi:hypothetical protein
VDDSITNESLTTYKALEIFYKHEVLFISMCKDFNSIMTQQQSHNEGQASMAAA